MTLKNISLSIFIPRIENISYRWAKKKKHKKTEGTKFPIFYIQSCSCWIKIRKKCVNNRQTQSWKNINHKIYLFFLWITKQKSKQKYFKTTKNSVNSCCEPTAGPLRLQLLYYTESSYINNFTNSYKFNNQRQIFKIFI